MKNILFLVLLALVAMLPACQKTEPQDAGPDCCPITCWSKGTLDTVNCSCNCIPGYGGPECDSLLFQQGAGLRFDSYKVDYMATAAAADVVEMNCVKYIKKGSDPLRSFRFTNVSTGPVLIKTAKGSTGALVPAYPKDPIPAGGTGVIEVRYDVSRVGEKLAWVELVTTHGDYRLMVKVRVAE